MVRIFRSKLLPPPVAGYLGALIALQSLEAPGGSGAQVAAAVPAVAVAVLGPVVVQAGGQPVAGWRTLKARDLLAYLVLAGDRPVTKDQIIEALWPETDVEAGQALLHTTLYYLRRAIKAAGESLITFAGGAYRLDQKGLDVDLHKFERLAASGSEEDLQAAVALYRGDLLEGLDYPWADGPRTRLRTTCMDLLRNLADRRRQAGRPAEAVPWLQRLVQAEPLAEAGHVGLMECYAALGNRSAALQQYRTLARLLDEELGLEPGPEAQALNRRLLD